MFEGNSTVKIAAAAVGFIALIIFGRSCVAVIEPTEIGVIQTWGNVDEKRVLEEGIHLKWPVSKVKIYAANVQEPKIDAAAATADLQELKGIITVYYQVDAENLINVRRRIGTMDRIDSKVVTLAQDAFKASSAQYTAEHSVTKRIELKKTFDELVKTRLGSFGITFVDSAIDDLDFSPEFAKSIEEKQIAEQAAQKAVYIARQAEQEAQAEINRARGKAEAQKLLAETLKAQGGELVLQKEAIEAWKAGGSQMPQVLVTGENGGGLPFILNLPASK